MEAGYGTNFGGRSRLRIIWNFYFQFFRVDPSLISSDTENSRQGSELIVTCKWTIQAIWNIQKNLKLMYC